MWLVLSEPFDTSGSWLAEELARRAPDAVLHLTSRDISTAPHADRGVADDGVWFRVVTAHGKVVESRKLRGVVNRICSSPGALTAGMGGHTTEAPALGVPLMRWLHRWSGPVLNRPNAEGLSGDFRPEFWWMEHAVRAGFAVPRPAPDVAERFGAAPEAARNSVVVIGDDALSLDDSARVVPASLRMRSRRLAERAGASILGVEATPTVAGEWTFHSATLRPDLVPGGELVVRSVVRALGMGSADRGAPVTFSFGAS